MIALTQPIDPKHRGNAYRKRVDFVITDLNTKILAVIELDDFSHNKPSRQKRDEYVNHALNGIHPFISLDTQRFYESMTIAKCLEQEASIKTTFHGYLDRIDPTVSSAQAI